MLSRYRETESLDAEPRADGLEDALPGGHDPSALAADWSVPWSDLMMVMFVLFAVLFIYESAERDVRAAFAEQTAPAVEDFGTRGLSPERVFEQSLQVVQQSDLENIEVILQQDRSVMLSASGPMFFELGSAELRSGTREFLQRVAAVLRENDHRIRVVGHTDSFPVRSPRFPTNWELSAIRATSVARFLIESGRLDPARFEINAHSMYRPAVPNTDAANKALNRRVEIIILPEES